MTVPATKETRHQDLDHTPSALRSIDLVHSEPHAHGNMMEIIASFMVEMCL